MTNSRKHAIIYTIFAVVIIAIIILLSWHFTNINRPTLQGIIECKRYVASSKIAGRIDSLFVEEGDWVERGERLYCISTPELHSKLKQVEALQAEANALNEQVDKGARKQQIEAAYSMVQRAEAGTTLAEATFQRIERLYERGVVARQEYDEAKANLEAMRSNLLAAKAEYSLAQSGATREQRQMAAAKLDEAKAAVEEVNTYINDADVRAPISGRVSDIISAVGELVGTGYPVVTILDLGDCWATFNIRESEMMNIAIGAELNCYIPALRQKAKFRVFYIASEADFATWSATRSRGGFDIRTFEIKARCLEHDIELLPGMSVIINDI